MSHNNTVFNHLLQIIPRHQFENLVSRHAGDRYVKEFTCWRQFMVLIYGQIRGRDSLRDIVTGLRSQKNKWYHLGLSNVARSTLSDANNNRDWRIFEGIFYCLLERCQKLTPKHKFRFKNPLYSLDSSIIELCLAVFPWAKFRKAKGALKIHCLLEHRGCLPSFIVVTDGKCHDVKVARDADLPLVPDSILVMDRAYIDFKFLYSLDSRGVYFVTRSKRNMNYHFTGLQTNPRRKGLVADTRIHLNGHYQRLDYPDELRMVIWRDDETGELLTFLTNNFSLAASSIAAIYKARWQIELFFKWIKQNLKIKSFLGTSFNAVMIQIWVAMCYYLVLTYIKYQTKYAFGITDLTRILSEVLMERLSILDILSLNPDKAIFHASDPSPQLTLF